MAISLQDAHGNHKQDYWTDDNEYAEADKRAKNKKGDPGSVYEQILYLTIISLIPLFLENSFIELNSSKLNDDEAYVHS